MLAEHLRAVYADYVVNSPLVLAISLYLYFSTPFPPRPEFLGGWLVVWVAYLVGRFVAGLVYARRREYSPEALRLWAHLSVLIQGIDGVMVAALALTVYPELDVYAQSALLVSVMVLVGATSFSLSLRWATMAVYATPIYSSFAWATWHLNSAYAQGLGIFILAMFVLFVFYANNQRQSILRGFDLARLNGVMAEELQVKNLELQEVASARSRLLATVSHDLRQPAHAIGLLSERALTDQSPVVLRQTLGDLNELSQSLSASLMTLMDLTRLDAGLVEARVVAMPLNQVLLRLAAEFSASARNKGLALTVGRSRHWVHSDPVLLHGILANLVSNAIKYTRAGTVQVRLEVQSDMLLVSVRDTGIGIHADKLQLIFKEFVRLDFSDAGSEGLGLGLSIVKRYANLLAHSVSVTSQLNEGSCFTVAVALAPSGEAAQESRTSPMTASLLNARLSGARVLVVDNVDLLLSSMTKTLAGWGCEVWSARNLDEALTLAREHELDLVISDFHLGDREQDGLVLIAELQRLPRGDEADRLKAVLMTGDVSAQVEADAQLQGVRVLHKPVRPVVLQEFLLNLLER